MRRFYFCLSIFLLMSLVIATEKSNEEAKSNRSQTSVSELRDKIMNPFSDIWLISYSNIFRIIDDEDSNKVVNQTKISFKTGMPIGQNTMFLLGIKTGARFDSNSSDFLGLNFETTTINAKIAKKINKSFSYALGAGMTIPNNEDFNNASKLNSDITFAPNLYLRYDGKLFDTHIGLMHDLDVVNTDHIRQSSTRMFVGLAIPILEASDISIGTIFKYDWTEANENRLNVPFFMGYNFLTKIFGHPVQLRLSGGKNIIKAADANSETFFFVGIAPVLKY